MTPEHRHELLPLYPLGLLDDSDARWVEAEAAVNPELARELAGYQEAAALYALAAEPVTPSDRLRSRLLDSLRAADGPVAFTEVEPGIFVHCASNQNWTPTPYPGVLVKQVAFDPATSVATSIFRMEPGSEFPEHMHNAEEQCYVIRGDVRLGTVVMHTGDFSRAATGSHHGRVWTETGCELLVIAAQGACAHD